MTQTITAKQVVAALEASSTAADVAKVTRFFRDNGDGTASDNKIMGVAFGKIFAVAKRFSAAPIAVVEKLLDSPFYEARMAAVSIMDFQARAKSVAPGHRKALFDLYLRRHERINNWDLVDRAAPHVVGRYLADRPRKVLYRLAKSKNPWERRTAIVSTYYFIRTGDLDDTFGIADRLAGEEHDLVQKAVGSWLREAGKKDRARLVGFLQQHAPKMPATMLRYATEQLSPDLRSKFLTRTTAPRSGKRTKVPAPAGSLLV